MTISSRNTRRTFVVYNTKAPVDTYYNGRHQINVADPIADDEVVNKSYFETNSCAAGDIKMSAMSQDHRKSGGMWLLCNGRTLNKTDYPALYQVIGGSFGSTTTTFNLPNCAGRVLGAVSTQKPIGNIVGSEQHTLTVEELPSHDHSGETDNSGAHNHSGSSGSSGAHTHSITDPGHNHSQTTINDDFNNSGSVGPSFSADSAGSMTWNNISSSTTGITINSAGAHVHVIPNEPAHSHEFTTGTTGGGESFSLYQPTIFIGNTFIFGK